jgi:DNA repair protein RAD16
MLTGPSTHLARNGRRACPSFVVSVPLEIPSSDESSSSSSLDESVQDTTAGYNTLATTTEVTPTGSNFSSPVPKRVSASARALELRTSVFSLGHKPGSRKRSIKSLIDDDTRSAASDACVARTFQADEYNDSSLKKLRLSTVSNAEEFEIQNSTDEDDDLLSEPTSLKDDLVSKYLYDSRAIPRPGSGFCSRSIVRDRVSKRVISRFKEALPDSADSLLSEPGSDISGQGDEVGGMEDTYHEHSSSDYSVSTADTSDDDPLIQATGNSRQNQRIRASSTRPVRAPISPLTREESRLGPRVRIFLLEVKKRG